MPASELLGRESHQALVWTPAAITTLVVGLRTLLRSNLRNFGTEDHLIILAWGLLIVAAGLVEANIQASGADIYDVVRINTRSIYVAVCCVISLACGKISVALLLLHLMGPTSRWRRGFVIISVIALVVITVIFLPVDFMDSCDYEDTSSTTMCVDSDVQEAIIQTWNFYAAFVDIAYSVLPVTFLWRLQMSIRRKATIAGLLSLGWTASVFTILRATAAYIWGADSDRAYLVHLLANYMEPSLVIICASLATLVPLSDYRPFSGLWRSRARSSCQTPQASEQKPSDPRQHKESAVTQVGQTPTHSTSAEELLPVIWVGRPFGVGTSSHSSETQARSSDMV